jgi:galactose mutarotase-like enzyme
MVPVNVREKENVLIKAGSCSVQILPDLGGKIASIRVGAQELLQAPLAPYGPRTREMGFDAGDASGWDECFPSVAACSLDTDAGPVTIPDHGDLWRVEWSQAGDPEETSGSTLRGECFSLPLSLERRVRLAETGAGWRLELDYIARNQGKFATPWSWAAHPLFAVEAGDRIYLPGGIKALRVEGSRNNRLGRSGDTVSWPAAKLSDGTRADLSVVQAERSGIGDKLFAGPLAESKAWCALERPSAGVKLRVSFDATATPYLGLWLCYGGWPERPGLKQMCVAMEPATAPVDSLAQQGNWTRVLLAGERFHWSMTVELETI